MKRLTALSLTLFLTVVIVGCGTNTPQTPTSSPSAAVTNTAAVSSKESPTSSAPIELTISAAASLTDALNEITANYATVAPNVKITVNYGASGTLQTQIENGAPTDIFFSAGAKQMDALNSAGLLDTDSITKLLKNEIVLVVPTDSKLSISKFEDTATDAVIKIALGDVKSVPAGQYAQDTFTFLNLWDKVSAKAVYGSDVKQVLSWVDSGNVDCGIVYKTDALSDSSVKVIAEAPSGSHKPIVYPVAIVKASTNQVEAAAFIKYLQSEAGINVFTKYGFLAS